MMIVKHDGGFGNRGGWEQGFSCYLEGAYTKCDYHGNYPKIEDKITMNRDTFCALLDKLVEKNILTVEEVCNIVGVEVPNEVARE